MKANRTTARSRKAQGVLEYAICLAAVLLAAIGMVTYVKRGVSGRYRDVVNAASTSARAAQYEPYYYSSNLAVRSSQNTNQTILNRGERITDFTSNVLVRGNVDYSLFQGGAVVGPDDPPGPAMDGQVTIPTSVYLTPDQIRRLDAVGIRIWGRSNYNPPNRAIEIDGSLTDAQWAVVRAIQEEINASPRG
jgi:uncharacterized protein (UPF0333 family)